MIFASDNISFYLLRQQLQSTLRTLFNWYKDNKLTLSISKCSPMVIDCPNRMPNQQLNHNSIQLQHLDCVKHLGFVIDNKLKWDKHNNRCHKTCIVQQPSIGYVTSHSTARCPFANM